MQRVDGAGAIPAHLAGGIVALGNFDGFHLGHQAVVGAAVARARAEGRPALVATFDPHPIRYFKPDAAPFRLTTLDQREQLFAAAGVDAMIVFGFDAELAALSAEAFVEQRLLAALKVGGVVTGEDFTFGRARSGDVNALRAWGRARGFSTDAVAPVRLDGETISSSRIRAALIAGDAETAARLLTRPYAIEGVVQHGDKLGRTIGYPTANLDMGEYLRPAYGIYAVRGRLDDGRVLNGAANLGIRPSFDPPKELLEPHFFDFAGDLYGRTVSVELIDYLRPEAKFDTLDALVTQMDADCARARQILSSHNPA
ncbi:bifunctional riboflavin kinase/FAD synthetase [Sphingomonas sanguinis]|jgi:riboflavin kinase/FMN adenylyltransferase|uniref:Riboflavin biosynthesis protein n=1 Tax=Sphingomonas sanguinis TaxID=33051 RepID=A0A7Y7QXL4_9SPHN|nr:bifunctional riboflavin kinase/FAD synthetase [Sphingomonas sanguinis]MBZ6383264.1 bifunctional riboflavin kinase/FAD synthetase [Sphingomonas sanguinis]NNG49928.1 bifunctional riboflavin kinase/FAD synthetase [Sphingomonas sanguinis]NNG53735.1 bifunctional riboflavin kinase/FAD synthetase [Sphingomonas sanguinis]NVP32559.1 bifunctional riboflavin kinase/FAD synthetase [Sphingomonas sanguinis]